MSIITLIFAGIALVFGAFAFGPLTADHQKALPTLNAASQTTLIVVEDAGYFSYTDPGLYLTRPAVVSDSKIYTGTVSTANLIGDEQNLKPNFYPKFEALVCRNDRWEEANPNYFWKKESDPSDNWNVSWCLRENAPAAVYCIRCNYKESYNGVEEEKYVDFQVLYQGEWNFVSVTNPAGKHQIANFAGGNELTLELEFAFNDGAASQPDLYEKGEQEGEGLSSIGYGKLNLGDVVTTETLVKNINIKTISGQSYNAGVHTKVDGNRVELRFLERLGKGIYVLQFTSDNYAFDTVNGRILGQFIIDNSGMKGGVNLSQIWVILMIFGGLLALGASSAYLVPLLIVKVNEARVDKENERIARMKNPEAYATKQKKSIKDVFAKIIYNIKTPAYERKKQAEKEQEEKKPVEEKVYSNRFTEMLRERQEKRDFMRENNITSAELEKIKEAKAALEQDELNSFSVLRDDEDEIATFHAAEDEISTLETGAYVENGTRFAKLDSLNDDGSSGDGESN